MLLREVERALPYRILPVFRRLSQLFAQAEGHTLMRGTLRHKCLIVAGDAGLGQQIASLLENCRWQTRVVGCDRQAYDRIQDEHFDTVIVDIDSNGLGGQDVLAFCYQRFPAIATYAIARHDDEHGKRLAREAGGCRGYFHLYEKTA